MQKIMSARTILRVAVPRVRINIHQFSTFYKEEDILTENIGTKGVITINRPKNHNSLNIYHVSKLREIMKLWEKEKVLVIVKGAGDKAFSTGGDFKICLSPGGPSWSDFQREAYTAIYETANYPVPKVSLMNGLSMGGGAMNAIFGRYTVATERTVFAMPEAAVGFAPDVGSSYFLPRLHHNLGMYLALTGDRIVGADMVRFNLATHYCNSSFLPSLEEALLKEDILKPEQIEEILKKFMEQSTMDETKISPFVKIVEECFSDGIDVVETIQKLENSEIGGKIAARLKSLPPLVLKIVRKQMENGKHMNLSDCLRMEYRINSRLARGKNFVEGVRTLLVEKGSKPNWVPATLEEVTTEMVNEYFEPLKPDEELQLG